MSSVEGKFDPFPNDTSCVLNIIYLPLDETDYINTETDYIDNFRWDRIKLSIGVAAIDGDEFGTNNQIITNAVFTYITDFNCEVTFTADPSSNYADFLAGKETTNRNYLIFITHQDRQADINGIDRTAVKCDVNEFVVDIDEPLLSTVINDNLWFYKFPDREVNELTDYEGQVRDSLYFLFQFDIDGTQAKVNDLTVTIKAEKTGEDDVILEERQFSLTTFEPDCEAVPAQHIDISENRGYPLPLDDPRNLITFSRNSNLDVGDFVAYDLRYGFMLRWEEWRDNPNKTKCFPEGTMDWAAYSKASGWQVKVYVTWNVENISTGNITEFEHSAEMSIVESDDPSSEIVPPTVVVETFDETETYDLNGNLNKKGDTVVIATVTGVFAVFPVGYDEYIGILRLDSKVLGGVNMIDEVDNFYPVRESSVWKEQTTVTLIDPFTIEIRSVIDFTKIRFDLDEDDWQLSARFDYRKITLSGS
jgi:hypothetical protein